MFKGNAVHDSDQEETGRVSLLVAFQLSISYEKLKGLFDSVSIFYFPPILRFISRK